MDRTMPPNAFRCLLLISLSLLALAGLAWGAAHALSKSDDLMRRAEEIALFVRGLDPYADPDMTYPPSAPPVFTPLVSPFSTSPAALRAFWLALNLGALAGMAWATLRLWGRDWPSWLSAAVVLAIAASKPVRGGIGLGQFHLIPTALALASVLAMRAGRPTLGGLAFGISLIKPTMALPLVGLFLARRQWRLLATASAFQAGAWLISSAWLGVDPMTLGREWMVTARSQEAAGLIDLPSLVRRLGPGTEGLASPLMLAILAASLALAWRLRDRPDAEWAAWLLAVAAVFTYHRPYDLVLLLPALAQLVETTRATGRPAWGVAAVAFALLLIWPSHPSATGRLEALNEPIFVPATYGFLALLTARLIFAQGRESDVPTSKRSPSLVPSPLVGEG